MASLFYPFSAILLGNGGGSTTYTGPSYLCNGGRVNENQAIKAAFNATQVGAGSLNGRVEGSWDNTNWITLGSMSALAAAGARAELVTLAPAAPYMRVVITPGGGATFTGAHVAIVSTEGLLVQLA